MSAPRATDSVMTADAFLASDTQGRDRTRYELFEGTVFAMASERALHARTKNAVTRWFERAIDDAGLPCEALPDGMAVRVDAETVFEPDALVRCGPRLADDALVVLDPIIVVEVASPSTQRIDALLKLTRYFRNASIMHYLIVLPQERSVVHHRRGQGEQIETIVVATGSLRLDPPGLVLDLSAVFRQ